ncbi:hypothetical protein ACO22_05743 [Paracoccidioides brasiliensis]|uniref:Indoleamine 2,3-dioxygenase n=1 Tax=Paracoccidioides brasiliensis TaxID=121759 RepID=A0A1D2J9Q5_PARBR|nr:hypothetical protein ACO22_05743 [Paracoccidioides brasiliensis]
MIPPIPLLADYGLSPESGFLPSEPPLQSLPDPYYSRWEAIVANLQALILSQRLRVTIDHMPILSTDQLNTVPEWRRAYVLLTFMLHGYIWGGDIPAEKIPPSLTIPLLKVSSHLELPPVATYASLCLWNYKSIFPEDPADNLENIVPFFTFTGSLDEQWFYLISIAIEGRGAATIPLMLNAISAARQGDVKVVTECLHTFAQRLDDIGTLLQRMYENCDPHVFYHRIRPFLAGSKNMSDAGLPNGIVYDDGTGKESRHTYGGGSNAQSSLIQFFDIVLNVEHRPTGTKRTENSPSSDEGGQAPRKHHNFIMEMRSYMPGPHRRFLEHVASVANIREFVLENRSDKALCAAYDSCLATLRGLRDKHIQMVSRYIIVKSRETRNQQPSSIAKRRVDIAHPVSQASSSRSAAVVNPATVAGCASKNLRGTGGTALIPFLKQSRDETGEPAIGVLDKGLPVKGPAEASYASLDIMDEHADGQLEVVGLAGTWKREEGEGGLCHW